MGKNKWRTLPRASSTSTKRSLSCPDISQGKRPVMPAHHTQSRRHINMMILNPRASKIRYLNASHTLLVDLEKHVRKVQELEHKVHKLEAQLQMKEMVKAELLAGQEVR